MNKKKMKKKIEEETCVRCFLMYDFGSTSTHIQINHSIIFNHTLYPCHRKGCQDHDKFYR